MFPDNVFVAAFIGSPSMNLYEAGLTKEEDDVWLELFEAVHFCP